jgi:beta-lactamase class A
MEGAMKAILSVVLLASLGVAQEPNRKEQVLLEKLDAELAEIARRFDGVMGIALLDLTSGRPILHHADEVFPTASTIKIAVLAELYRQSEQAAAGLPGKARLTDFYTMDAADLVADSHIMGGLTPGLSRVTNRDLAVFMVAVSDNAATNVLIDRLGMENVNAFLQSLGLRETRLRRKMMDLQAAKEGRENTATPRELVALLEAIYRGKAIGSRAAEDLLKVLSTPKESPIPRLLPDDVRIANKPGALEGVRCDAGIIFAGNRPFILAAMASYAANERAADDAISRAAAAAYSCFERLGRSSPYGRVISPRNSR